MGKGKAIFGSAVGVMMAAAGVAAASPATAAPGPAVLWVAASGPTAGGGGSSCSHPGFTTIQAAISAAPSGATVAVCAGTYPEQLQITRSVSVRAVGQVTVTLPGTPAISSTACDTAINAQTHNADQDAVVTCGPVSVSLTGITIDAAWPSGTCNDALFGIMVAGGSTLTFADSAVTSAGPQPINGCQGGIGIRAGVPGTTPAETGHLNMRGSSVAGYNKGGVVVSAAGSTALISNTTVRGAGPTPVIAQNGIQVSSDAKAAIAGSTVSGNECDNQSAPCGPDGLNDIQSAGVLLFGAAAGTTVTGSTLRGNDMGVYDTPDTSVATTRQPDAVLAEDTFTGNRSPRARGVSGGSPRTMVSKLVPPAPAPTPRTSRPPQMSSTAVSWRAKVTGWRKFGEATIVPSRIREVTAAAAVSVGMASNHGPSTRSRQPRWSYVQAWANP